MREVFVDTSAWYEVAQASAPHHARTADRLRHLVAEGVILVTTNLVVAETYTLLRRRAGHQPALTFARAVTDPPNVVVRSTAALERLAIEEWLEPHRDQDYSFTDAVSFAVMREREIGSALALDRHFAAAGFAVIGR